MSVSETVAAQDKPWGLWARQVLAILRLDLRRIVLGRRALGIIVLAYIPVFISLLAFVFVPRDAHQELGSRAVFFAILFRTAVLRAIIFFGCVVIFTNLFRGELLERTLHYYLLAPVRREVLAVGKYVSGVVVSFLVFGSSTTAWFFLTYAHGGVELVREFFLFGPGLGHLAAYWLVILLAVAGYGAFFMVAGMLIKNPVIPAVALFLWESINFLLPGSLKVFSVIFYLESLCPVAIPQQAITILAAPAPAWVSIPAIAILITVLLALGAVRLRRLEINYSSD